MPGPNHPYTQLSADQVIQQVFDESTDQLRVNASVTATIGDVVIDAEESNIAIKDPVTDNILKINSDGSIDANVAVSAASGDSALAVGTVDGTTSGTQRVLKLNGDGTIRTVQLFTVPYDTITCDNPDPSPTVEIYRSRVGGLSGTVQQVATITYRDSTKARIDSVVVS